MLKDTKTREDIWEEQVYLVLILIIKQINKSLYSIVLLLKSQKPVA